MRVPRGHKIVGKNYLLLWLPMALCMFGGRSSALGEAASVERPHLPTLTSAHGVHSLTREQAAKGYPVHLSGVITYFDPFVDPKHPTVWVSDSSGGIYVALASPPAVPFQAGDELAIDGVSATGGYAPIIRASEVRVTGRAPLSLTATKVTLAQMLRGSEDGQWVEVEGVVQAVRSSGQNIDLDVALSDGSLMASTLKQPGANYADLVDTKLKIRGNQAPLFNQQGAMTGAYLLFPDRSAIEIEERGPPLPFDLPILPIGELLRYSPKPSSGHRVHVRGVVTLAWPGRLVCIDEGPLGLCAQTDQTITLNPGAVADVVGFPAIGAFTPTLSRATYAAVGPQQQLAPIPVTISQAADGLYDARLVQVDGQLVGQDDAASDPNITLVSQGHVISVVFAREYRNHFPEWKDGSTLRVVGVCSIRNGFEREPAGWGGSSNAESLQLRLRSLQDVAVIQRPSWWTPFHAVSMLASAAMLTALACGWVLVLRKRVDGQTFIIRQQLRQTEKLGQEVVALNNDLERKILERTAALKTANHELEAFSYSVSHDLRTPLRHIAGFSRILLNDFSASLPTEAREHLQRIQDAVARTGLMVDALLSLAKLGPRPLRLQSNPLNPIVERARAILASECEGRVVEWRIAPLPSLACDETLLGLVFQNLIGNALKYSRRRECTVIEIGTIEPPADPPVIFVRDNGAGFDMTHAGKLFGVFQRLHTQAEFEGTGVGLATAYRIVHKHGGRIWAEAKVDGGATFYFTLGGAAYDTNREVKEM